MTESIIPEFVSTKYADKYRRLKSFLEFTEFWLRVKVDSDHGRQVNKQIIEQTKRRLKVIERLAMTEQKAKHILVAIESDFENEALFMSIMDRFVSQSDLILCRSPHWLATEYADACGCPFSVYDTTPNTVNFVLVFAVTNDFVISALNKAHEIGKIAVVAK